MKRLGGPLACVVLVGFAGLALVMPRNASAADYDCSDFSNQAQAQQYLLPGDPYGLDADHDGVACESLPCPCSTGEPTPIPTPPPPAQPAPPPVEPTPVEPQPIKPHPVKSKPESAPSVYWRTFDEPLEVEPQSILIGTGTLGGTFAMTSLVAWEHWGTRRATVEGFIHFRTCTPSCIQGKIIKRRATVALTKVRRICGPRRYTDIKILVDGGPYPVIGPYGTECSGLLTRP